MSTDGTNYEKITTSKLVNVFDDLSLANTYYFKVSAVRDSVEGIISDEIKLTPSIAPISNFKVIKNSSKSTSANLSWDSINGVDGYELYLEGNLIYKGTNTSYTDKDLVLGKNHNYSVRAYKVLNNKIYYSDFVQAEIKPMAFKVENIKITPNIKDESIIITFDKLDDVIGYKVLRSETEDGTYSEVSRCESNSCTVNNVTVGTYYYYKVVGYTTLGDKEINGNSSDIKKYKLVPNKVTNLNLTSASLTSIKVAWDKMDNVDGYEVYYATSKSGKYTKAKTTTSTSTTITKLATGKTYYFKVRSYKTVNGKKVYSSYSDIKNAYARPIAPTNLKISRYDYSSKKNKITWDKVSGASGYEVYRSQDGKNYSKLTTTTSTSYIDKKASNTKTNFYKVRAYKTVSGKKIYSEYSTNVFMAIPDKPSISYWVSSNTDTSLSGMFFTLSNTGAKPLKILSSGAKLYDNDSSYYDRTAKMIDYIDLRDYATITYISSYTIQPNTTSWLGYIWSKATWYDKKTRFFFYFIYDGVKYQAYVSSYYGSAYAEV